MREGNSENFVALILCVLHFIFLTTEQQKNQRNAGANFSEGLQALCNNFGQESMVNTFDIALTDFEMDYTDNEPTMAATQGMMPQTVDDVTAPAGNLFSYNPSSTVHDYYSEPDANSVIYFSHSPSQVYNVIPQTIEGELNVEIPPTQVSYSSSNSCPSEINYVVNIPSLISKMALLDSLLADEWDVYYERVDNGSTSNLIAFILNSSNSSLQVRNELMLHPTDISDDAWKAAIYRIPAMNPWHLAQALIAGSPLRPEIIDHMEISGIDQFYLDLVKNNQSGGITDKMILESEIVHFNVDRQHSFAKLVRAYLDSDSTLILQYVFDQLEYADEHVRSPLKADILMKLGLLDPAEELLDKAIAYEALDEWCEFKLGLLRMERDSLSWDEVSGSFLAQCYALRATWEIKGSAQAHSFLAAISDSLFDQEIAYPMSVRSLRTPRNSSAIASHLEVYPNPASHEINVVLSSELAEATDRIDLVDSNGRFVCSVGQNANAIWIVDVSNLANGHYVVRAISNEKILSSAKVHVVR